MQDRDDWVQDREEELAIAKFGNSPDELTEEQLRLLNAQACEDFISYYASEIDRAYDRWCEQQMMEGQVVEGDGV